MGTLTKTARDQGLRMEFCSNGGPRNHCGVQKNVTVTGLGRGLPTRVPVSPNAPVLL